jgi:hypothetical protein
MDPPKKLWPTLTIRVFAVLNLLLGLEGFAAMLTTVTWTLMRDAWSQDPPFYAQAFYFRSAVNLVFVVLTLVGAVYLWRLDQRGWRVCKTLFIAEIAYFFLDWYDFPLIWALGKRGPLVSMALAASAGTGNMGTTLQVITAYPVIGLITLKIAYGKLAWATSGPAASPPPSPLG